MDYILDSVNVLFNIIFCIYFLWGKYSRCSVHKVRHSLFVALAIIIKIGIGYLQISSLNFISGYLLILVVISLLFTCSKKAAVLYSTLLSMLLLCADAFGVILVSTYHKSTISVTISASTLSWQRHIWVLIFQIVLIEMARVLIVRKDQFIIKWHEIMFYILVTAFEVAIFAYISNETKASSSGIVMLLIMIGFLILDIYILYVFHKISQLREKECQTVLMNQQEHLQLQMYQELQKMYQKTCASAHDINRHISALQTWISEKSETPPNKYLSDLYKVASQLKPRIQNQNAILEIILNTASARCEEKQIQFNMEIEDFPMSFVSDMDMTTIFSNLLDNAIDACAEQEEDNRKIDIVLCKKIGLIALRITNTCKYSGIDKPQKWHSTKENHMGIGLSNVEKTVEKYNGGFSVKNDRECFHVAVTLPIHAKI